MKKLLSILFFFLTIHCFAERFTDHLTGMSFEVPTGFEFNEEESGINEVEGSLWYLFSDSKHNVLTVEIDEYDHIKSLPEHFHFNLTSGDADEDNRDGIVFEGMDFRNINIGGMEFTKCKLRILAVSNMFLEPICICDYLFVKDHFGFTISLTKREDENTADKESDAVILKLLNTIQFSK